MKATYDDAILAVHKLTAHGHTAYLAGGCVRDLLLDVEPNDYDIATSATPEEVQVVFDKTVNVGASFGVIKVMLGADGRELDVATYRTDGIYSDNRRPDTVTYSKTAEEDVARRDFTINALLWNPEGSQVLDYVGGQTDLEDRVLRTVGDPVARFTEDALRMMRAIRFAIRFKMTIDSATWNAIVQMAPTIEHISEERITEELTKTFSYGDCDRAYLLLHQSGLWTSWFGIDLDSDDNWRSLLGLKRIQPGEPFILVLAIILTEAYSSYRQSLPDTLALTNAQRDSLNSLLIRAPELREFLSASLASQRKMMVWDNLSIVQKYLDYQSHLSRYTYQLTEGQTLNTLATRQAEIVAMGFPDPLINGNDLQEMGFVAGPIFTKMLELVRDEQLEGRLTNKSHVKSYLIYKFPATPRLVDGVLHDDTKPRRVAAQCPHCSSVMSVVVPKSPEGKYLWDSATDRINCHRGTYGNFFWSECCYSRKKKTLFVEMHN